MRKTGYGLLWLGAVLLGLAGCHTPGPSLKPPEREEVYSLPPSDDPRFSNYIRYPEQVMARDPHKKDALNVPSLNSPRNQAARFGAGSGIGP